MTCGADFHGINGDDIPPEDHYIDDSPTNLDGDGYPFPPPPDASTDAEIAEREYPGIGTVLGGTIPLHTHAPGYDATSETIKDHLRIVHHYYVTTENPWHMHKHRHPESIH